MTSIFTVPFVLFIYWISRKAWKLKRTSSGSLLVSIDSLLDTLFLTYIPSAIKYIAFKLKTFIKKALYALCVFPIKVITTFFMFILLILLNFFISFQPTPARQERIKQGKESREASKRKRKEELESSLGYCPSSIRWIPNLFIFLISLATYPFRLALNLFLSILFHFWNRLIGSVESALYHFANRRFKRRMKQEYEQQQIRAEMEHQKRVQLEYAESQNQNRQHERDLQLIREINKGFESYS